MACYDFTEGCLLVTSVENIPDPRSRVKIALDPGSGSATKNKSVFDPKNCFSALGNMIRDVYSGPRIPDPGSPDPG
jgi:hypothetical protein